MENNTTYEQEIDLKDLVFSVLRRWRPIILVAIIFGVLLGGYKVAGSISQQRDEKYVKETQEKYTQSVEEYERSKVNLEKEIENIERDVEMQTEYVKDSILMNISPYDKYSASADIFLKSEETAQIFDMKFLRSDYAYSIVKAYTSYINKGMDWAKLAKKMGTKEEYLKELVSVSPDYDSYIISLTVCYKDEAGANRILEAILDNVEQEKDDLNNQMGVHELYVMNQTSGVSTDTGLADKQKATSDNITVLQDTLKDKKKTLDDMKEPEVPAVLSMSTVVKSSIKYTILGGVLGGFLAVFFACVAFLMSDKMVSEKELRKRYRIKVLAVLPVIKKKRILSGIDRWIDRLDGKADSISEEAGYELVAANLCNYAGDSKKIMVTGTVSLDKLKEIAEKIGKLCSDMTLMVGADLNEEADTVSRLPECDAVILVEQCGISRYSQIEKEIETVQNVKKEIVGAVIL